MEILENPIIAIHPGELTQEGDPNSYDFEYKIINVVCLGVLTLPKDTKIDFDHLEQKITVKRLNRFPCVMFKIPMDDGKEISCILFRNGKIIITGLKHQRLIPMIKKRIITILDKGGVKYHNFSIDIQNLVVMTNLHRTINLELSCLSLTNCLYEPEQFPAAIVKQNNSTCLIFSNSKIISLGNKTESQMKESLMGLIKEIFHHDLFLKLPDEEEFLLDDLDDDLFL